MEPSYKGEGEGVGLGLDGGGFSGQMKVGERFFSGLRSYFQRTLNPVRGPDWWRSAGALLFPQAPADCAVEQGSGGGVGGGGDGDGRGKMMVWWVRVLAALSGPRP